MSNNGKCFPVGYRGQQYEVRAKWKDGGSFIVGWCDAADGGGLIEGMKLHPGVEDESIEVVELTGNLKEKQESWEIPIPEQR